MNALYDSKPIHRQTWYSPTGFAKRIYYILAEWHIKKLSSNCRVYRKASIPFESDHRLVVMSCSFPSTFERKKIFRTVKKGNKPFINIKSLKDNPTICSNFSMELNKLLKKEPIMRDVNSFEKLLTDSVYQASDKEIPKVAKTTNLPPWTNDNLLKLQEQRRKCKDPSILRELNTSIKHMRTKLKNDYFSALANNINLANEARKVEEEFRLCKNYYMTRKSQQKIISNEKLSTFFENHFKKKQVELQPEVTNPENFPHVLPPDNFTVNSSIPEVNEVHAIMKDFKNGKCLGTDLLHPEHLKYNKSDRFMVYLMLLLTTIWTTFIIPSSWLISSISCLYKNKGSRNEADNYRGISIMSTCSKILTSLIISRIRNAYEMLIMKNQFGFRSNRSTTDAIFILQNSINLSSKPLFCASLI